MSAFEDAVIQRIKQLEREVERLQKWERAADLGLGKLSDPNADRVLFWDDSAGALKWLTLGTGLTITDTTIKPSQPQFYPLTAQLTSTSWDGDARSTTAKTLIDLSSVFEAPAGVKAVIVNAAVRDSGSAAAADALLCLGPNDSSLAGQKISCAGLPNDVWAYGSFTVPCDSNGDIYYQIVASGSGTMDVYLEIWGYWL